jgi:hypothetical protein
MAGADRLRDSARILLACIRLFNGLAALFVPGVLARQLGVNPDDNPGMLYVFRMFGIRTVLIGPPSDLDPRLGHRGRVSGYHQWQVPKERPHHRRDLGRQHATGHRR